jgi:hypothetical protein
MGVQPKCHALNPHRGGHGDQEGHLHHPKGPGPKLFGSGVHDVQQQPHFWAPNVIIRYTIEELLDITAKYAINEEAAEPLPVLGNSRAVLSGKAIQDAKKTAKGGKKR